MPGVRRRPAPAHLLLSRPWARAPLAAFGQPGASAAVLVATAILGIAAATAPLFLSTAETGALHEVVATCPELYRPAVTNQVEYEVAPPLLVPATQYAPVEDARVRAVLGRRGVPTGERVIVLGNPASPSGDASLALRAAGRAPIDITAFSGRSALDHVDLLSGRRGGRGLWLPDRLAERLGADAGDRVAARGRSVPVAGVYRDLGDPSYAGRLPLVWCRWTRLILARVGDGGEQVRPLVLADDRTLLELAGTDRPWETWFVGTDPATARGTEATEVAAAVAGAGEEVRISSDVNGPYADAGALGEATDRAARVRSALSGAILPAVIAAMLVALLLVAAAGGYWAERRAADVRLLAARGVGPPGMAGKAVLEMIGPAVAGALLGWALTVAAAPRLGPSPLLDDGAAGRALRTVAVALVAGLLALGLVAGLRGRSTGERPIGIGRTWRSLVPWELLLVGAGVWAYQRLRDGNPVDTGGEVVRLDPLVVALPLLLIAGLAVLAVRLAGLPAGRLGGFARRAPVPVFLALRRLTGARAVSAVVLVAVAVPVGVQVVCASLTASVQETVRTGTRTYVGAEVTLRTDAAPGVTPDSGGRGTPVSQLPDGLTELSSELPVLGVDPATFARYAFWRGDFATEPLPELLARLGPPPVAGGRVPAILAGASRLSVGTVALRSSRLPVDVVAQVATFPGMRTLATPLLVVDRRALVGVDRFTERTEEVWTDDRDAAAVGRSIGAGGLRVTRRVDEQTILRATDIYPLTWTFGYVQALASLAGAISVTALLLYLAARQRTRTASYVLSRRMGLTKRAHVASLVAELSVAVGGGAVAGTLLAWLVLQPVVRLLELEPGRPPAGVTVVLSPQALLGALAVAVAVVLLGALAAQLIADRARPAEVLRGQR